VAIAAASAVLDAVQGERLQQNALEVGDYLRASIKALQADHPTIGDVRGAGLFIGVEMVEDAATRAPSARLATRLVNGLRERRVLISSAGPNANVLKIRPPLIFSKENADTLIAALADTLQSL
jgi:4-aminobutyrate aminotransferase-like enzyme